MKKWGRRSDAIKKRKEGRKEVRISGGSIFTQGREGRGREGAGGEGGRNERGAQMTRQLHDQMPFPGGRPNVNFYTEVHISKMLLESGACNLR